jgi:hypothetical protein
MAKPTRKASKEKRGRKAAERPLKKIVPKTRDEHPPWITSVVKDSPLPGVFPGPESEHEMKGETTH